MKILVAEDDPVSIYVLKKTLEYWGHEVVTTNDGVQAWRAFNYLGKPDIVISDWEMPRMTGPELCEKVRSDQENENIYFIMLTARDDMDDMKEGYISGVDDYISKPVTESVLRGSIDKGIKFLNGDKWNNDREDLIRDNIIEFEKKHISE